MAISQPLERKISNAIGLLKAHEPPDGYYLAYSGGKDSGFILELAKMAGVKFEAWYNCVTIDPPELIHFIKRKHPEVKWNILSSSLRVVTPYRLALLKEFTWQPKMK